MSYTQAETKTSSIVSASEVIAAVEAELLKIETMRSRAEKASWQSRGVIYGVEDEDFDE